MSSKNTVGRCRPHASAKLGDTVRWPETLQDRVVRLRIAVGDIFDRAITEVSGTVTSSDGFPVNGQQIDSLHSLQTFLHEGRAKRDSVSGVFGSFDEPEVTGGESHPHRTRMSSVAMQGLQQQVLQLVQADVLAAVSSLADEMPHVVYSDAIRDSIRREFSTNLAALQKASHTAKDHSSLRPASAGAAALPNEGETQLRHLYMQLHDARTQLRDQNTRVEALKAFCLRKDSAMEYIRETLLHEVVVLKEQLRRQEHDPNFISEFVTLFDCWKVLEGDDPSSGSSGNPEAMRQLRQEMQAEAAKANQQTLLVLKSKDEEIAQLQARLAACAPASPTDRRKSLGGKKGNDAIHEQFLQLTSDMAKKDVRISDLQDEVKQLQTEVAIAQQLAKSSRDQLNRSSLDVDQAVAIRDRELSAKADMIASLEAELEALRSAAAPRSDADAARDEMRISMEQLEIRNNTLEREFEELRQRHVDLSAKLTSTQQEADQLRHASQMSGDELKSFLERQVRSLEETVRRKDDHIQAVERTLQAAESESRQLVEKLDSSKFEVVQMRQKLQMQQRANAPNAQEYLQDETAMECAPISTISEESVATATLEETPPIRQDDTQQQRDLRSLEKRLKLETDESRKLRNENLSLRDEMKRLKQDAASYFERNGVTMEPTVEQVLDSIPFRKLAAEHQGAEVRIAELVQEVELLRSREVERATDSLLANPVATYAYSGSGSVRQLPKGGAKHRTNNDHEGEELLEVGNSTLLVESLKAPAISTSRPSSAAGGAKLQSLPTVGKAPSVERSFNNGSKEQSNVGTKPKILVKKSEDGMAAQRRNKMTREEIGPFEVDNTPRTARNDDDVSILQGLVTPLLTTTGLNEDVQIDDHSPHTHLFSDENDMSSHRSLQGTPSPTRMVPLSGIDGSLGNGAASVTSAVELKDRELSLALQRIKELEQQLREAPQATVGQAPPTPTLPSFSPPPQSAELEKLALKLEESAKVAADLQRKVQSLAEANARLAASNESLNSELRCAAEKNDALKANQPSPATEIVTQTKSATVCHSAASQTESDVPTVVPSRVQSASAQNPHSGSTAIYNIDLSENLAAMPQSMQRVFSAHRRNVHAAGTPASVTAQQRSGQLPECAFMISGDGEVSASAQQAATDVPYGNALPAGGKKRAVNSAGSNSSRSVVDKLSSAVTLSKGFSDAGKARAASANALNRVVHQGDEEELGGLQADDDVGLSTPLAVTGNVHPTLLSLVDRPMTPAILTGNGEVQILAVEQLQQRTSKGPNTMAGMGLGPQRQSGTKAAMSALPTNSSASSSQTQKDVLPRTVDCREHVAQVVLGGTAEQSALRGVKEKIKQNINVDKFLHNVLNRRK